MDEIRQSFSASFVQLPKGLLWVIALTLTALLGLLDFLTGFEISFAFFYLLPVSIVAWTMGRGAGILISVVCAAVWLLANWLAGEQFSSPLIPYWNTITRAGFFIVISLLLVGMRRLLDHERSLARTDFLTGVLNTRAFYNLIDSEIARASRYHYPFTILYIDLDNFKSVNDRYGHNAGDRVLLGTAQALLGNVRQIDSVARLGGDEFAVLLPETDESAAQTVVPRLREALLADVGGYGWSVTFSIGALTCLQAPPDSHELIRCADQVMYQVKSAGKNAIRYSVFSG